MEKILKAVILAGGFGTRLSEETYLRPKPMVEIGNKPILWHIMKIYSHFGINDFIICLGYKGYLIKEFFANYTLHTSDVHYNLLTREVKYLNNSKEPWKISLVDTGQNTMTGGRLKRISKYLNNSESFCLTYGDGVTDLNIRKVIDFHKSHGKKATVTAVNPLSRYGSLDISDNKKVNKFSEKPINNLDWINGGFFVLEPSVLKFIEGDSTSWELDPLKTLSSNGELMAYKHNGFWQSMDTLREKQYLEQLVKDEAAPWIRW